MIESFRRNKKGILLMLISAVLACVGQLCWKFSATEEIYFLLIGFALYGAGALIMIVAYRYGHLSVLQPILSSGYVLSLVLGAVFLDEKITITKSIGVLLISIGIVFIAGGDEE